MIKIILQSMKSRRLNNILMVIQFTVGFAALLVGIGCVENVLQYKRNVESLAPLETVHISVGEYGFSDNPAAMRQAGIAYATEQIIDLIANGKIRVENGRVVRV